VCQTEGLRMIAERRSSSLRGREAGSQAWCKEVAQCTSSQLWCQRSDMNIAGGQSLMSCPGGQINSERSACHGQEMCAAQEASLFNASRQSQPLLSSFRRGLEKKLRAAHFLIAYRRCLHQPQSVNLSLQSSDSQCLACKQHRAFPMGHYSNWARQPHKNAADVCIHA
jgi:hypothetical protein